MAITIQVIFAQYTISGWVRTTETVYPAPTVTAQQHEIIGESLPELTLDVEQETGRFAAGEITLTARNDDLWWNPTPYGSGAFMRPDPYMVHGSDATFRPSVVRIFKAGILRWEGDIDLTTVSYDRVLQTVTFTAIGALGRLATFTAETVRRSIPAQTDYGISTSVAVATLNDTTKAWTTDQWAGYALVDFGLVTWYIVSNTATALTLSTPYNPFDYPTSAATTPSSGTYQIRPFALASRAEASSSTGTGLNSLTDASKTWASNQWALYWLEDSAGTCHPIASNTGTVLTLTSGLTPAAGAYSILYGDAFGFGAEQSGGRRILKSRGRTWRQLGIQAGDRLKIVSQGSTWADNPEGSGYWWNRNDLECDEVEVLQVPDASGTATAVGAGTLTDNSSLSSWVVNAWAGYFCLCRVASAWQIFVILSNTGTVLTLATASTPDAATPYTILRYSYPALTADKCVIRETLTNHIICSDTILCTTPYYRGATVETLVRRLYSAAYITSPKVLIPSALAALTVPYADFDGKSVADALGEFAAITGCCMFVQCGGDASVDHYFRDRDYGTGALRNIQGSVLTQQEGLLWDRFADGVVVTGAEERVVVRGSQRYGGSQLEVGSDYVSTYSWLRAIADRLWAFFGLQRRTAEVEVLGEFNDVNILTFEDQELYAFPFGFSLLAGTADAWVIEQASGSTDKELLGETLAGSKASAIACDYLGAVVDCDIQVDLRIEQNGYAFGLFVRGSASGAYAVLITPSATPGGDMLGIYSTVWTSASILAYQVSAPTIALSTWYTLRVQTSGAQIRARVWATGSTEPTTWGVIYYSAVVSSGYSGLYATKQAYQRAYFDNFKWPGTQWNLYDRVSLDGTHDSWIVTGVTEPLDEVPASVKLRLISSSGTTYTPSDEQTEDPDALPEPPTITGYTGSGASARVVAFTWPQPATKIAAIMHTVWSAQGRRPETPVFARPTFVAGDDESSSYTQSFTAASLAALGSAPWLVDIAVVMVDGRISKPSDPYEIN